MPAEFMAEQALLRGLRARKEPGAAHGDRGKEERWGSNLGLSAASARGDEAAKWQGGFCPPPCQAWLRQAVPFLQREVCSQDAKGLGAEQRKMVSPDRVWGGCKWSKLPVALFSEEVLSVNRACGRVCPGQR